MLNLPWFDHEDIAAFPDVALASSDPDGLLAFGGNLSVATLQNAYQHGIFPWFEAGQPIMWWSPSVRAVLAAEHVHISKTMRKLMQQNRYHVKADTDFEAVIKSCGERQATWITAQMLDAYCELHRQGIAHSIEVFDETEQLVGGLYGVFVNNCFCGESMFSWQPNTSKLALIRLAQFLHGNHCRLIDCQLPTAHLCSMGAVEQPRQDFCQALSVMPSNNQLLNQSWETLWRLS